MLWSQLSLEVSVHRYFEKALSKKVHGSIPQGIVGGFECTVFQRNLKEWQGRGGGGGWGKDICLRVLKESKALRLWLRERREGRGKMSDVPAETGNGLWESLKCAGRPYLGSITSRYLENELGLGKQRKSSLMCTYHYSISVRLDSNINLLVKLGSVVRLKPDLLTLGMRAKLANFACDFRIHFSRISEKKNAINS